MNHFQFTHPPLALPDAVRLAGRRIIIAPLTRSRLTASGIEIPFGDEHEYTRGIIARVSALLTADEDFPFTTGEHVLFSSYGGKTMKINEDDYVLVDDTDVYVSVPVEDNISERAEEVAA